MKATTLILALLTALAALPSCNDDQAVPAAANRITGLVDGTAFTANEVETIRDTTGLISVTGAIQSDARFTLYFREDGSGLHPVEQDGAFSGLAEQLDNLFNADPPLPDSLLQDSLLSGLEDLLANSGELLGPAYSFLFYNVGGLVYYSLNGLMEVPVWDEELNRFSGSLDMRLANFRNGRKDISMELDDLQIIGP